jgi:predicted nucleotidyltransferase
MSLPTFEPDGNLPPGLHPATLEEVLVRFGGTSHQREIVSHRLSRIYNLAVSTKMLDRFILFGSYVTAKLEPNDVDIVLVMKDDFNVVKYKGEATGLFDHQRAEREFGASVFWIRPIHLALETLEEFIAHWQMTRNGSKRGIVEIVQ